MEYKTFPQNAPRNSEKTQKHTKYNKFAHEIKLLREMVSPMEVTVHIKYNKFAHEAKLLREVTVQTVSSAGIMPRFIT
jgi:hypothetical protein